MRAPLSDRGALLADFGISAGAALGGRPRRARIDALGRNRWPSAGATLDLDFVAQQGYAYGQGIGRIRDLVTISGGAGGTVVGPEGLIVPASAPRFDYDPVSHVCKGLLIEEQRTNGLKKSGDLTDAVAWSGNPTRTLAAETWRGVPFYSIAKTQIGASEYVYQASTLNIAAGGAAVLTVALLAGSQRSGLGDVGIGLYDAVSWGPNADSTARIVDGPGAIARSLAGGGLWVVSGLSVAIPTVVEIVRTDPVAWVPFAYVYPGTHNSVTIGDSVKVTRLQMEAGSFSTSYIPTTSAAVTRTSDLVQLGGSRFGDLCGAAKGTLYIEASARASAAGNWRRLVEISDGTSNNRIHLADDGPTGARAHIQVAGASAFATSTNVATGRRRQAIAWGDGIVHWSAAGLGGSGTYASSPPGLNQLAIGGAAVASPPANSILNDVVRRAVFWPRQFSLGELQELTR